MFPHKYVMRLRIYRLRIYRQMPIQCESTGQVRKKEESMVLKFKLKHLLDVAAGFKACTIVI